MAATSTRNIVKVLTTPTKIANALDWKKQLGASIATIDVHADRIGLTISQHPSCPSSSSSSPSSSFSSSSSPSSSYSLPIRRKGRRKIPNSSRQQLSDLVRDNNVCGFVVSWPLQSQTGLAGAACGRTLHAIEELLKSPPSVSSSSDTAATSTDEVFTRNRKLCLWDGVHLEQPPIDKFGRSSVYTPCDDTKVKLETEEEGYEYRASQEQYHEDESIVATKVWEDFVRTNWPTLYQQQQQSTTKSIKSTPAASSASSSDDAHYDDYNHYQHQHQGKTLVTVRA